MHTVLLLQIPDGWDEVRPFVRPQVGSDAVDQGAARLDVHVNHVGEALVVHRVKEPLNGDGDGSEEGGRELD